MITLLKFRPAFGLPDPSPFCTKVELLLQLAGQPYRKDESGNPGRGPKGKLPAIIDDGEAIGDSELIRWHLERKYRVDLDAGMSGVERAHAHALARLLEERTYWAIAATRWLEDAHFPRARDAILGSFPMPLRWLIGVMLRRRMRAAHRAQGMGRHSTAERYEMAARDIRAVAAMLGDKQFMTGDSPRGLDATVYPFISGIVDAPFPSPAVDEVRRHANLLDYCARMQARFFADWPPITPRN